MNLKINLNNRKFKSVNNSDNGDVNSETIFHYHQSGDMVTADYRGGQIVKGHLIARAIDYRTLDVRYHHINIAGELKAGTCISRLDRLPDGRIKVIERWRWLTGDQSSGFSEVEEIVDAELQE